MGRTAHGVLGDGLRRCVVRVGGAGCGKDTRDGTRTAAVEDETPAPHPVHPTLLCTASARLSRHPRPDTESLRRRLGRFRPRRRPYARRAARTEKRNLQSAIWNPTTLKTLETSTEDKLRLAEINTRQDAHWRRSASVSLCAMPYGVHAYASADRAAVRSSLRCMRMSRSSVEKLGSAEAVEKRQWRSRLAVWRGPMVLVLPNRAEPVRAARPREPLPDAQSRGRERRTGAFLACAVVPRTRSHIPFILFACFISWLLGRDRKHGCARTVWLGDGSARVLDHHTPAACHPAIRPSCHTCYTS